MNINNTTIQKSLPPRLIMLAVIVPAYKPQFFQLALNSIAMQSNKNFQCYIFDDAAPEEIKSISNNYPDFHYVRFNENMGRYDLVGHWHRCLELVKEKWVWFFSDDDVMSPNCVDEFYNTFDLYPNASAFRFSREFIDENGQITGIVQQIKNETGLEYLKSKLNGRGACLQDHIFDWRKLKEINGGFVNFPLAWCSDDAIWCLLGKTHEIIAIPSAIVQIRMSSINISSIETTEYLQKKLNAYMLFYLWCIQNFRLPLSCKFRFIRNCAGLNSITPFSYYFQPLVFQSPIFILVILLIPIRKLYFKLKKLKNRGTQTIKLGEQK